MSFSDSKPHYALLDGLRGVAALLVVWYHIFEGFQFAAGKAVIDGINHGYLAVDYFYILEFFASQRLMGMSYSFRQAHASAMLAATTTSAMGHVSPSVYCLVCISQR